MQDDRTKKAYIRHCPEHKNSKGKAAPFCIISHETGAVISSHATKEEAEAHLKNIEIHKKKESEVVIENFKWFANIDELLKRNCVGGF